MLGHGPRPPASQDHAKPHPWLITLTHTWIHSRQPPRFTFTVVAILLWNEWPMRWGGALPALFFLEKLLLRRAWPFSLAVSFTFWNFDEVDRPPSLLWFWDCDACVSLTATLCLLQQGDTCVTLVCELFFFFWLSKSFRRCQRRQ